MALDKPGDQEGQRKRQYLKREKYKKWMWKESGQCDPRSWMHAMHDNR